MDQHPVPRQITTFEFKLIGFMTLRQFIYLLVFIPLGYVVYKLIPIPFLNFLLGFSVAGIGPLFAFVPFNDRPIDMMLKNLVKRLTSPTQYFFHKENPSLYFLQDLFFASDPHQTIAHVDSQAKLATYLAKTGSTNPEDATLVQKKQSIVDLFLHPQKVIAPQPAQPELHIKPQVEDVEKPTMQVVEEKEPVKQPFVTGVVTNNKKTPLPGILIYIKDQNDQPLRLLKTNPHGVFATYNQLPPGDYKFEIKDPKGSFFFDTMKLHLEQRSEKPLEFSSKELL
ncbi:hypothetical protein A3G67_00530 [Candidatus Roizmanbacteria bacterium RIFCSPLOWO2_12_FULL_40_12]|uniref:SD-repeat containing protein B domain-containing protein n=1 Tax=Candidatus Roizmanbacteria bacterium RIFCSPLOWO2_01_FULL_40_42 TaxID=1802066 RepID=A0A1F7J689_9BACT|nr:MAG: hypothetical protein A2779_02010 [Candidatus Roizmanbacteria bacterium RIFCSPHIGHO2_01_FULL_40_98]OGK28768.1 MAG: hypothetical protein A3C31_03930 [Candidatus Roizmanbacteria bacterium RIFCSPHIGHO2_02_FULL_40_53]OGK29626.1 MAG: hypothetical protein A2W49_00325 [Candidatus Roizmanbacteria bacterium RIFCSPHIGHO2_12_41_18]OGK36339.1 MAG: hypothetical protein A3E69_02855 [Candidatus Roizmanbacteria bacterium RIFCSPHIGHO2_12_FULL_40_130]OGK51109.1 MAG: hypothetical protein A3B50_04905 [Candi